MNFTYAAQHLAEDPHKPADEMVRPQLAHGDLAGREHIMTQALNKILGEGWALHEIAGRVERVIDGRKNEVIKLDDEAILFMTPSALSTHAAGLVTSLRLEFSYRFLGRAATAGGDW